MTFAVHTFEINPSGGNLGFSFHEDISEGQALYFLGKFADDTTDAKMVAETIFGAVVESFSRSQISDPYDRFEDALKSANLEAQKLKKNMPSTPEIVMAFFDFNTLYLSQSGESEAYLVRGTSVSQITESAEDMDLLFSNILNGQVALNDTILLSSSRILRFLTTNQLVDMFGRTDFSDAVSLFRHELTTASDEDILVTAIGVGRQDSSNGAGFLSKMVSKGKAAVASAPKAKKSPPKAAKADPQPDVEAVEAADFEPEQFEDEAFAPPAKEPLKVKHIVNAVKGFKPQKNLVMIAGAVFGVLVLVLGIRFVTGYESADTQQLREEISIAREAITQADTYLLQGERQLASDALLKAEESVQVVLNSKSKNFRSDAQFLLADIQNKKLQVENAKKVTPQLIADLGVKNDNLEAAGLLELRGSLYVHDLGSVYKTVRNIVEKGLPISEKETILAGGSRTDQNTLLFLTDNPRIVEYREGLITPMGTEDETWKRGIDLKTYGRYAYILDPAENQIWKYERRRSNYSSGGAYNQGADLSRGVSMSIDGSIYVLSDDGTIQKLFRGTKTDFSFRDLPSVPFSGKNLKMFTSMDLDFIYVLDPDNARVLVFTKGDRFATYKKQILFDLPDARDFIVDESGQKVSVLTTDKIYEFPL